MKKIIVTLENYPMLLRWLSLYLANRTWQYEIIDCNVHEKTLVSILQSRRPFHADNESGRPVSVKVSHMVTLREKGSGLAKVQDPDNIPIITFVGADFSTGNGDYFYRSPNMLIFVECGREIKRAHRLRLVQ